LLNDTDAEVVTGASLTTASLSSTYLNSGTLTVGVAAGNVKTTRKTYLVQLRRNGGVGSDTVFCELAQFEVLYGP
jgi:hypothetical protein